MTIKPAFFSFLSLFRLILRFIGRFVIYHELSVFFGFFDIALILLVVRRCALLHNGTK